MITATRFSDDLDDWGDLSPTAPETVIDDTSNMYSNIVRGPDGVDSSGNYQGNTLQDRLRIGTSSTKYILIDPVAVSITLGAGGTINLKSGGDIILEPSDANPALIKWSTTYNFGAAITGTKGLCFWPTVAHTNYFQVGYNAATGASWEFLEVRLSAYNASIMGAYYDANNFAIIGAYAADGIGYARLFADESGTQYEVRLDPGVGGLFPHAGTVNLGTSVKKWNQGWFNDYVIALGGIHVGGTADPGTDNLVVDRDVTYAGLPSTNPGIVGRLWSTGSIVNISTG